MTLASALAPALAFLLSQMGSPPPDATATRRGLVNTKTQTFGGLKTFVDGGVSVQGDLAIDGGLRVSGSAVIDGGLTVGGFPVVTATSAPMTLFVEKDGGSDSNACTDAGVGACLTLAGALAKVPKFLNHSVTVNVAAGAYAETFAVDGFSIAQGATLAITGTMTTATLTTGTATGTVTSYAAPSVTAVPSITDSAQSWTASNLRGRFVTFTSGALSGQSHPIYDNTATTITLPTTAASMNGATYTIQDVGSVWTSTTSNRIGRLSCGTTCLTITAVALRNSGTGVANSFQPGSGAVTFVSSDLRASGTNSFAVSFTSGSFIFTRSYMENTAGSAAISVTSSSTVSPPSAFITSTGSVFRAVSNGAVSINRVGSGSNITSSLLAGGGAAGTVFPIYGPVGMQVFSVVIVCLNTAQNGIGSTPTNSLGAPSIQIFGTNFITGCASAVAAYDGAALSLYNTGATLGVASSTTGLHAARGGHIFLNAITPTFTGVTNEIQVDGTNYTHANLVAASPQVLYSVYGSWVAR
jgi:hypothetical protein